MCQNNHLGGPAAPASRPIATGERERLREQIRELEGRFGTVDHSKEVARIAKRLRECVCRTCGKLYDMAKGRADFQGFCSAKCQHAKAKACGYKAGTGRSEFEALKRAGEVGSVYVVPEVRKVGKQSAAE